MFKSLIKNHRFITLFVLGSFLIIRTPAAWAVKCSFCEQEITGRTSTFIFPDRSGETPITCPCCCQILDEPVTSPHFHFKKLQTSRQYSLIDSEALDENDSFYGSLLGKVKPMLYETAGGLKLPWPPTSVFDLRESAAPCRTTPQPLGALEVNSLMESVMMDSAISTVGQSAASQPQGQDTLSLEQAIEFPIRLNREAALQVCREQGGRIPTRVELETICRKMGGKHLGESHYAGFDLNPSQDGADRIYWLGDSDSVPTSDEGNYYWAMQLWRTSDASAAVLTFQFSEQPFSEMTDLNVICLKN